MSFNNLTDAEDERLTLLAEECAEVIQAVCKIQRHGYESHHPDGGPDNRDALSKEVGDVMAAIRLMVTADDFCCTHSVLEKLADDKLGRVFQYLHHNGRYRFLAAATGGKGE
jgi:hypothetical protein